MPVINKYHHGGRVPAGAVDIMRGSLWGNPFVVGRDGDRDDVVEKYRRWLWQKMQEDPDLIHQLATLDGKTLCCCCAPKRCHGDVLESAAKWAVAQKFKDSSINEKEK